MAPSLAMGLRIRADQAELELPDDEVLAERLQEQEDAVPESAPGDRTT